MEKKIQGILFECAIETGIQMPDVRYREFAAHAIAEWIRKGMVWQGPGKIGKHGGIDLISPVSGETYGAFCPWPPGRLEETPIGQRLQLTVTKVEGGSG